MKVVVLGAGALGSIMAGHLARAGEDVTLVARGERAAYLTDHGITVTGLAEFNVPCAVVTDPSQINQADVLIVAVKTHQMDEAISGLSHIRFSAVTTVQNGVRANDQLAEVFGAGSTLGGVASFSGEMLPEGDVRFTVNAGFQIGELPEGSSDRVKDLCAMLQDSGVNSEAVANIQTHQWSKFVLWVGATSVAVLTRQASYRFFSDSGGSLICARVMREVAAIAGSKKIPLQDSGPFPVAAVTNGSEEEAVSALQELGAVFEKNSPGHRMSALQDLERGRRLEIDETLGYVVAEARRLGVPVPTLETCYSLLEGINREL
ncbi:MAG TPA: 2-dehydropantoate 2-reductase [Dehalococcoidia bacterium]|nr:2-dehydropantoate 2-reductase [Dehalococcoidia bacterium]HIN23121.1 2-dehydropantoate 2-reductase [Dehalococcoidia bacterium]